MKKRVLIAVAVALALVVPISLVSANGAGPVSYWPFDEGTGTTAYDAINDNDGTIVEATYVPGKFGTALSFDGNGDYVNIPDDPSLDITGDITLAAWIKIDEFSTSEGYHLYAVSKDSNGQRSYGMGVDITYYAGKNHMPFFIVFDGSTHKIVWGTTALATGTWYHIAGVFDASTGNLTLYVDGTLASTETSPISLIFAGTADLRIGARQYSGNQCFFNGVIDEVGIWDRALSAEEVELLASPEVDTEGPVTSNVLGDPNPAPVGAPIGLTANVDDSTTGGSNIASAEYSLDGGDTWSPMIASDSSFDGVSEDVLATIPAFTEAGVHDVCVRGTDEHDNTGAEECIFLAVYDATAGFVTGGGWIWSPLGAYAANSELEGKATFGFVSKYKKGATVPTGQTQFQFRVADLNFHSTTYEWLVIAGAKAQYKGTGTINGTGDYGFMLTATDGQINGGGDTDKFRIKIWNNSAGDGVIYDNKHGAPDTADPTTELGGGNIVIHKKK